MRSHSVEPMKRPSHRALSRRGFSGRGLSGRGLSGKRAKRESAPCGPSFPAEGACPAASCPVAASCPAAAFLGRTLGACQLQAHARIGDGNESPCGMRRDTRPPGSLGYVGKRRRNLGTHVGHNVGPSMRRDASGNAARTIGVPARSVLLYARACIVGRPS